MPGTPISFEKRSTALPACRSVHVQVGLTLVDTSAWIEFLRKTGSGTNQTVRSLVAEGSDIATCDVVIMELLSGTRTKQEWKSI